ncbi:MULTISPECIES: restriction endonuclease subunit S [Rhizobium]|uniref:restriction endonuclease subunit S n=1 Tax=Rhizobium phaseoli TaxID=396 RepID=UPI000A1C112C|nr:restriction endonuclease subunit S [Rhizobium phaseoli]ARM10832.1 type I restriction-modification system subunit HsdS [Rhizobium phaseoli Brasil 5]
MNAERLLQHYEKIADAPDAIARLRRFILDLAVRGKLVPQDSGDEPACQLLAKMRKERQRQVELGTLRRATVIEFGADHVFQFEEPKGWCWVTANDVWEFENGDRSKNYPSRDHFISDGVPFVNAGHLMNERVSFDGMNYISEEKFNNLSGGKLRKGDQIYCLRGSLGKHAVYSFDRPAAIASSLVILRPMLSESVPFLKLYLSSDIAFSMLKRYDNGTAQPNLSSANLKLFEIPLPPLAEQYRIVAKVDELMALCDELEAARTEREAKRDRLAASSVARLNNPDPETFRDDARFALDALQALTARPNQIKQLRQTILNLAVRGKLVPQDPSAEPAEELLKRIAAERDSLVRQKEIRRDAPLEPVSARDCPHVIPSSWTWGRVGDAVLFTQYGTSQKSHVSQSGVPVLTMGNIQDGSVIWGNDKRIPESSDDLPALYLKKFDLLYNRTNSAELVGKTGIYLGQSEARTFASYLIRLRPSLSYSDPLYLNVAMNAPCFRETQIVPFIKKQTGQANVSGSALKNMLIPLPPLAEQHRIVAKVDDLMAICDQLETGLTSADETRKKLLDALLAEALALVETAALQEAAE